MDFDSERIMDAKPFLTTLLGYPHTEFLGKKLWDIGPFKDIARSKIALDELKTKRCIYYEEGVIQTS